MSSSLYFYKISRITEILPEIIYKDRMDFPYYEVHTENAADWEREVGLLRTIEYSAVDMFAASEKLFGKRPNSICQSQYYFLVPGSPHADVELIFADGEKQRVHRSEMEKFRSTKQYTAYVYNRETIGCIEKGYLVEARQYENRPLSKEELLEMARRYLDEHGEEYDAYSGYAAPLYEIMKAFFAIDDGECVICRVE